MKLTALLLALLLASTAHGYEITDELVNAVIAVESSGRADAWNRKTNCRGLMQVSEICLEEFNRERRKVLARERGGYDKIEGISCRIEKGDLFNAEINRMVGTWYLRRLKDKYGCKTIEQVLAAYNGGITRLRRVNYDISKMPKETREYVRKVLKIYNRR